jgi:hypothetical protein
VREISSLVVVLIRSKDEVFERERRERGFRVRSGSVCESRRKIRIIYFDIKSSFE